MRRIGFAALLFAIAVTGAGLAWWLAGQHGVAQELALHGSVEFRQVALAFNSSERITAIRVEEGDHVKRGQILALLDTSRIDPQIAQAEAQVAALNHVVEKLHNGARPEEIAQARANVDSAEAESSRARQQYERAQTLSNRSEGRAVSQQDLENASAVLAVSKAKHLAAQRLLDLIVSGPRPEEIAEAEARLHVAEAQLAFLRQQMKETQLVSPVDGVVRTRIMEPGEIAFPQKPVLNLAATNPKWVRAYASEPDLGRVKPGTPVAVTMDSFPGRPFGGWIGFVSPVAEFTPKTVQTEDLRPSLVYEVRVFVSDPGDELRLGMPATVRLRNDLQKIPMSANSQPATAPARAEGAE